jgi:hypothetical protein
VRPSDLFTEQREKHVFSHAKPHLEVDEEIVGWARAHHPEERRHGFAYLTTRRFLVVWSGHHDGQRAICWPEIVAWGVDSRAERGPLLGIESAHHRIFVHMPARNQAGADRARAFLGKLERLVPHTRRRLRKPGHRHAFETDLSKIEINRIKLSPREMTKRIVITMLGVLLIFTGAVITPIPGPWSFPILLAGLAVLASEYEWAHDVLEWVRAKSRSARERFTARRATR